MKMGLPTVDCVEVSLKTYGVFYNLSRCMGKQSTNAKTKTQISCAVTAQLISAFVFATRIAQSFQSLSPKFQAYSYLLCMYRPVCVIPGRKTKSLVFSWEVSFVSFIPVKMPQDDELLLFALHVLNDNKFLLSNNFKFPQLL